MAQTERRSHKQRIQLKVIDVGTGEEQVSGDIIVVRGFCSYSCSTCTGCIPSVNGPPERVQE